MTFKNITQRAFNTVTFVKLSLVGHKVPLRAIINNVMMLTSKGTKCQGGTEILGILSVLTRNLDNIIPILNDATAKMGEGILEKRRSHRSVASRRIRHKKDPSNNVLK